MSEINLYLIYVVVKYIVYSGWCYVGLRLMTPDSTGMGRALAFGGLRLALGIFFGFFIFFLMGSDVTSQNILRKYIAVYGPVRIVEWLIVGYLLARRRGTASFPLWCLGGVVVSFLADLVSPAGLEGHFCVGRCLC